MNDFYKIGQVIEVRGQKLRIRVFENKNSNILVYQGHVIKNVSVGSFVKIPKGFSNIIGRIEGEYIQENKSTGENNCQPRFSKESETIDHYFIHRLVNNEDIRAIGKAVAFIDNTSYEMISVLPQGACIFTGVASNFPVLVQVDLLPKQQQPQSSTINLTELWKEP